MKMQEELDMNHFLKKCMVINEKEVKQNLVKIIWLPKSSKKNIMG